MHVEGMMPGIINQLQAGNIPEANQLIAAGLQMELISPAHVQFLVEQYDYQPPEDFAALPAVGAIALALAEDAAPAPAADAGSVSAEDAGSVSAADAGSVSAADADVESTADADADADIASAEDSLEAPQTPTSLPDNGSLDGSLGRHRLSLVAGDFAASNYMSDGSRDEDGHTDFTRQAANLRGDGAEAIAQFDADHDTMGTGVTGQMDRFIADLHEGLSDLDGSGEGDSDSDGSRRAVV